MNYTYYFSCRHAKFETRNINAHLQYYVSGEFLLAWVLKLDYIVQARKSGNANVTVLSEYFNLNLQSAILILAD